MIACRCDGTRGHVGVVLIWLPSVARTQLRGEGQVLHSAERLAAWSHTHSGCSHNNMCCLLPCLQRYVLEGRFKDYHGEAVK